MPAADEILAETNRKRVLWEQNFPNLDFQNQSYYYYYNVFKYDRNLETVRVTETYNWD